MPSIVSIVPHLGPPSDGVGDYALLLARGLRARFGIDTTFFNLAGRTGGTSAMADGFEVMRPGRLRSLSLRKLFAARATSYSAVLVHYSHYGYSLKGVPFWLVRALRRVRKDMPGCPVVIVFHEVNAGGCPPWTTAFWANPLQRRIARSLCRLSAGYLTTTTANARFLKSASKRALGVQMPVFSTVGEPSSVIAYGEREPSLAVFGSWGRRIEVYRREAILRRVLDALELTQIWDIGAEPDRIPAEIAGRAVVRFGPLSVDDITVRFQYARAGAIQYPPDILSKSTIFAAYCAHGMLPICISNKRSKNSPPFVWTLTPQDRALDLPDPAESAAGAFEYYQQHRLSNHVHAIAQLITA